MKKIILIVFYFTAISFSNWQPDFEKAMQIAHDKHRLILLNFSGSDWCGPCIRMRKKIFDNKSFFVMADSLPVMVNADFPRNKKNQLEKSVQAQNEKLADKYNAEGKFPLTLLLDENGKVLKTWDGLISGPVTVFISEIKTFAGGQK